MARISSFPAVADARSRVLVLGSMPGGVSLEVQQYYAHPGNQFWPIIERLHAIPRALRYRERLRSLRGTGIALWDVLQSCVRPGSLDSSIERASAIVNDVPALLRRCPGIVRICCNGGMADATLRRRFGPELAGEFPRVSVLRLPSTSPAAASWSFERKLEAWREALAPVDASRRNPLMS